MEDELGSHLAEDSILLDRKGAVAFLTLNRPDAGNAINVPLARQLLKAAKTVEADNAIRCLVVRARGKLFCAGGDVKALHAAGESLPDLLGEILASLHPAIACLANMNKPVITAIQGPAAGAGLGLAAVGDIVLAEPDAHFSMAYSRIGLTPDGGATWLLPRLIGLRRAQELALTNRRVTATEAAAMGLITRVVAKGSLTHDVDALAEELAASARCVPGITKRLLLMAGNAAFESQLEAEQEHIVAVGGTTEAKAALSAFMERR